MHSLPFMLALLALSACTSSPAGDGNEAEIAVRAKMLESAADNQADAIINQIEAKSREQSEAEAPAASNTAE